MRLLALIVALAALLPLTGTADAQAPPRLGLRQVFSVLQSNPTIPEEWAGIWNSTDSVFTCAGALLSVEADRPDTLCAGVAITEDDPSGMIDLVCSGTATADEVHVVCTGNGEIFEDCEATITLEIDGTRTGDNYAVTLVTNTVTQGTGLGCGSAFCQEVRTTGVRIEPEPTAYCATQNLTTTWGRVKVLYR